MDSQAVLEFAARFAAIVFVASLVQAYRIRRENRLIELEQIHLAKGHKGLPFLKGETVALIVNYVYKEEIGDYLWTAICQECGSFETEVKNSDAKLFITTHNKSCGLVQSKKRGI